MTATEDRVDPQAVPRARRWRDGWWVVGLLVMVLAVVVLGAGAWIAANDDDGETVPAGSATTVTTGATTTVPETTTTTGPVTGDTTALWPFPGSTTRFTTPEEAARSFATEFLRFENPTLGAFEAGDTRSGEVPVRPSPRGPATTVLVRQVGPGDDWSVLAAVTDTIEVTTPAALTEIGSPVAVAGRALAFEGHVQVEVRADGDLGPIGRGFVIGGGDVMRPFEGTIPFETPGAPHGALVFFTQSGENGQVWAATAFRVAFRSTDIDAASCGGYRSPRPQAQPGQMEVKVYFSCDAANGEPRPAYRLVPQSAAVLRAALDALLAGPTEGERAASLNSFFSAATADMLRSVTIAGGHAVVDFDDLRLVIPNASSSAGSERLLRELDTTVFQFTSVESVEYRIEGSCGNFNEWLQYGGCEPRRRGISMD